MAERTCVYCPIKKNCIEVTGFNGPPDALITCFKRLKRNGWGYLNPQAFLEAMKNWGVNNPPATIQEEPSLDGYERENIYSANGNIEGYEVVEPNSYRVLGVVFLDGQFMPYD